jgi:hypothetical protein
VVTLFGTSITDLPGLIINEALPVGVGVGLYSLARIQAYRFLQGQRHFGVNPVFVEIGADTLLVITGVIGLNLGAGLGGWGVRIAVGWLGYGTLGLIQTILLHTTGWDPLSTISMGNPHVRR